MRFSFDIISTKNEHIRIPLTYRRNLQSLIKEALKQHAPDLYNTYWGSPKSNTSKPFTYSLYVPQSTINGDDDNKQISSASDHIKVFISSCDTEFILHLYNALLNCDYSPFTFKSKLKHFILQKESPIHGTVCTFKTFSPVIVRKTENKKGTGYLTPDDDNYCTALQHAVHNGCSHFLDGYSGSCEDIAVSVKGYTVSKVPHYNESIPATNGEFTVSAHIDVLRLVYDIGLGARRSQGFGMVEVVG